jgi:hypothetical protein
MGNCLAVNKNQETNSLDRKPPKADMKPITSVAKIIELQDQPATNNKKVVLTSPHKSNLYKLDSEISSI